MTISNSKTIIGYITPRPFGPFSMPAPAQNSCLREYAKNNNFSYGLPQTELIYDNCFVQFFETLQAADCLQDIVLYSKLMLPKNLSDKNKMNEIINEKNIKLHCVLEKLVIDKHSKKLDIFDISQISEIISFNGAKFQKSA